MHAHFNRLKKIKLAAKLELIKRKGDEHHVKTTQKLDQEL